MAASTLSVCSSDLSYSTRVCLPGPRDACTGSSWQGDDGSESCGQPPRCAPAPRLTLLCAPVRSVSSPCCQSACPSSRTAWCCQPSSCQPSCCTCSPGQQACGVPVCRTPTPCPPSCCRPSSCVSLLCRPTCSRPACCAPASGTSCCWPVTSLQGQVGAMGHPYLCHYQPFATVRM